MNDQARTVLLALVAVFLVAIGGGPAAAVAQSGSRQTGTVRFSSDRPGSPTGLSESALYQDPNNPGGKPPAVRTIAVRYAPGFTFDTSVPALCTASDSQLQVQGDSACPTGSLVGHGGAVFATGFPGPASTFSVAFDIFNDQNQLIFIAKQPNTGLVIQVSRSTIHDGTITTNLGATPGGPPDGQSSARSIHFELNQVTTRRDGEAASYLTTPPTCPSSRLWTSVGTFTYADGISETIKTTTPCVPAQQPGAGTSPPAQSALRLAPRKVSIAGRKVKGRCVKPTRKNRARKHCRQAIKLEIRYTLNRADTVTFTLKRKAPGRKVGGRCVKSTHKNHKHKRCTRWIKLRGRLVKTGKAGANRFTFNGKLGGNKLGHGSYELIATPRGGKPKTVKFKIVR